VLPRARHRQSDATAPIATDERHWSPAWVSRRQDLLPESTDRRRHNVSGAPALQVKLGAGSKGGSRAMTATWKIQRCNRIPTVDEGRHLVKQR